jgi:hypothetical protein
MKAMGRRDVLCMGFSTCHRGRSTAMTSFSDSPGPCTLCCDTMPYRAVLVGTFVHVHSPATLRLRHCRSVICACEPFGLAKEYTAAKARSALTCRTRQRHLCRYTMAQREPDQVYSDDFEAVRACAYRVSLRNPSAHHAYIRDPG